MALTAAAYFAPKSSRPQYDPSSDDEPDDCVCVLSVGMPFRYVIPSFDIIAIEMRQMKIEGYTTDGKNATTTSSSATIPPSVDYIQCGWLSEMEQL